MGDLRKEKNESVGLYGGTALFEVLGDDCLFSLITTFISQNMNGIAVSFI